MSLGPGCIKTQIAAECCYVRFGDSPLVGSHQIGQTVRGERMIADVDADGRISGIELVGGPAKPCQTVSPGHAISPEG